MHVGQEVRPQVAPWTAKLSMNVFSDKRTVSYAATMRAATYQLAGKTTLLTFLIPPRRATDYSASREEAQRKRREPDEFSKS